MIKPTLHNLKKMESLFKELGYRVRYGSGNFQAGTATIEQKSNIVINKLFGTEARIAALLDVVDQLVIPEEGISEKSMEYLADVRKHAAKLKEVES